jgi:hypothetical protein
MRYQVVGCTAERGIAAITTDVWYGGGAVVGCSVEVGDVTYSADSASSPA